MSSLKSEMQLLFSGLFTAVPNKEGKFFNCLLTHLI